MKNNSIPAMLAAFFSNFIFGFSFLFSKLALETASPFVLLAWRFFAAFLAISVLRLTGLVKIRLSGKKWGKLILLGMCQPVIYFICENYGLVYATSTFSSVMIALVPIAALLFAAVFMGERPSVLQVVFSLLSIGGVVIMALQSSSDGSVRPLGILLLVGAVCSAVAFNVISRKSSSEFSAIERTYVMMATGFVSFALLALFTNLGNLTAVIAPITNAKFAWSVLYLGIMSSILAFFLINYANTYLPLARSTAFSNIITVVSLFAGALILKEKFNTVSLAASFMIIAGVIGVQKFRVSAEKSSPTK